LPDDLAKEQADASTNIASYFKWIDRLTFLLKDRKQAQINTFDTDKVS